MIIKPKTRGFICTTAHPVGCEENVIEQINYVKQQGKILGPKRVLVIGASTGYGLASRISAAFGSDAATIGVFYERQETDRRTATAGWYNSKAFEKHAKQDGLYAKNINGDAFSNEIKHETIQLIKKDLGQIDLVIYSLASPRRTHPITEETYHSVLKPIKELYSSKTVDFHNGNISDVTIEIANDEEVSDTIKVMGGEDWEMWIEQLKASDVLAKGATTVAYSYIGPDLTHAVYRDGTIGQAKSHLEETARKMHKSLKTLEGRAYIAVNKALVTQSSSAIPVVPLYISILYKVMKEKNLHEGCIEQMYRLFKDQLYSDHMSLDDGQRIRMDDYEMRTDVQEEVTALWQKINSENINVLSDIEGYRNEFYKLFGFGLINIDYTQAVPLELS